MPSDKSSFSLTPIFNASIPQIEFNVEVSLRTVLSITVEDINVGALFLDLPAFSLDVATLTNALSDCKTPPSGTPSDQIYGELIHMNGSLIAGLSYELLGGRESGVLENWHIARVLNECYAFFPGLGFIGAVPSSSKSELLTAAPITKCTAGAEPGTTGTAAVGEALRGLSPGAKAGAVIGELLFWLFQFWRAVVLNFYSRDFYGRHPRCNPRLLRWPRQSEPRYQESQNQLGMDRHPTPTH